MRVNPYELSVDTAQIAQDESPAEDIQTESIREKSCGQEADVSPDAFRFTIFSQAARLRRHALDILLRRQRLEKLPENEQIIFKTIFREASSEVNNYIKSFLPSVRPDPTVLFRKFHINYQGLHFSDKNEVIIDRGLIQKVRAVKERLHDLEHQEAQKPDVHLAATIEDARRVLQLHNARLKHAIVHEMIHAKGYSFSRNEDGTLTMTGVRRLSMTGRILNRGLDEGLTEWITQDILGEDGIEPYSATVSALAILADALNQQGYSAHGLFYDAYFKGQLSELQCAVDSLGGMNFTDFSKVCNQLTYGRSAQDIRRVNTVLDELEAAYL